MRASINGHKTRAKITVDHSLQDIQCHCVSTKIALMPILNRDVSLTFVGRTVHATINFHLATSARFFSRNEGLAIGGTFRATMSLGDCFS